MEREGGREKREERREKREERREKREERRGGRGGNLFIGDDGRRGFDERTVVNLIGTRGGKSDVFSHQTLWNVDCQRILFDIKISDRANQTNRKG